MPSRKKRRRRNPIGMIIIILILLFLLVVAGTLGYFATTLGAVGDGSNSTILNVEDGESFDDVLKDLESQKMIKDADTASLYAKFNSVSYYAGMYEVNDGMNLNDMFEYLSDPSNARKDAIIVTIPEGKWARDIAGILAEQFPYSKKEILALWNDEDYLKSLCAEYEFLNFEDINNSQYRVKLEGYLFPETYSFDVDASLDTITHTLLNQFDVMYQDYKDDFNKSKYSVHELVTFASIVQFESGYEKDMPKIASVFYNRLENGMNLESSVTVCYALYEDFKKPSDCEIQVDIDSPYNTYLYSGFPVGPILNAGRAAFDAVLKPVETEYFYFVADIHGDGKVYFSKTLEEHEQYIQDLNLGL